MYNRHYYTLPMTVTYNAYYKCMMINYLLYISGRSIFNLLVTCFVGRVACQNIYRKKRAEREHLCMFHRSGLETYYTKFGTYMYTVTTGSLCEGTIAQYRLADGKMWTP